MARIQTKTGDVFEVKVDDFRKKYFQYTINDLTQLNSDVIRVFKKIYSIDQKPELAEIVDEEIEFYAHCVTKIGVKMGLWNRVGNIDDVGKPKDVLFRISGDAGCKPGEFVSVSEDWYVWRVNDKMTKKIGKLLGENRNAEIGLVYNPANIVHRIKTGVYNSIYPGFE